MIDEKAFPVATNADFNYAPEWSPDGKKIIFISGKNKQFNMWMFEIETKKLTQLTTDSNYGYPAWSPDGKKLAFTKGEWGKSDIYILELE